MKLTWLPPEMSLNPVAAGLLCSALFGCDDRPYSAYAALPPPGERPPAFEAPLVSGGLFSSAALFFRSAISLASLTLALFASAVSCSFVIGLFSGVSPFM